MVHVLRQIHKALKPDGVLLDVHPLPRAPAIEVWYDGRRTLVDHLDYDYAIARIRTARSLLSSVVSEGLLHVRSRRFFDLRLHFSSVNAWLEHRKKYNEEARVSRGVLERARNAMRRTGGELVITERTRATLFRVLSGMRST